MPSTTVKRKWTEERMAGKLTKKPRKNIKRQKNYYSSSDESGDDEGRAYDAPKEDRKPKAPVLTGVNATVALPEGAPKQKAKHTAKLPVKSALKKTIPEPTKDEDEDEDEDEESGDEDLEDAEDSDADDSSDGVEDLEDLENLDLEQDEFDDDEMASGTESETSTTAAARKVRKRNDPEAFATSISRILGTKLTTTKRQEPILARSKSATEANKALADHKLTVKAQRAIVAEKKSALDKGRVKDVLGLQKEEVSTAEIMAGEKALRRTAQRGVIKLFNAVRAAQVKAEQAEKDAKSAGVIGVGKREEMVKEMSKQGFLDMITSGGKKTQQVEEEDEDEEDEEFSDEE